MTIVSTALGDIDATITSDANHTDRADWQDVALLTLQGGRQVASLGAAQRQDGATWKNNRVSATDQNRDEVTRAEFEEIAAAVEVGLNAAFPDATDPVIDDARKEGTRQRKEELLDGIQNDEDHIVFLKTELAKLDP